MDTQEEKSSYKTIANNNHMTILDYTQKDDPNIKEIQQSNIRCAMGCGRKPDIVWMMSGPFYLCAEDAQYLATHLLKDVREYEIKNGVSIKVRTQRVEAPHMKQRGKSIDDAITPEDDIPR